MTLATCSAQAMTVVRPDSETLSRQCLPYFVGVSGASTGATGISMNLVVIPPHGSAEPHYHRGFETAVYMMKGRVDVRYGPELEEVLVLEQGDFLFIPADMPHQPINHDDEPALAIVARNDANEQESVEIFHRH
ncbi:MAG TPA: cupin domain-containing protein [Acidimicrobiia bacterium]|nr:cupin domain-containing protein [Acidimicrobiia bacterium]